MTGQTAAVAIALTASLLFGLAFVLTQLALRHMPAATGAAVSVPTSCLLFWCAAPFRFDMGGWNTMAALIFFGAGLLYPGTVTLLTFAANHRLGPSIAAALGNLTPLFAVGGAMLLLGETPRPGQIAGLFAVVAGALMVSRPRGTLARQWPLWALALPVSAALIRGLVQPALKAGLELWPDAFATAVISYTASSAVLLAAAAARRALPWHGTPRGIAWFVVVGLANGSATFAMYQALALGSVSLVSPLIATYPLATLALGAMVLGLVPDRRLFAGVALIVAGVALLLAT